jgi:hypothetical protein
MTIISHSVNWVRRAVPDSGKDGVAAGFKSRLSKAKNMKTDYLHLIPVVGAVVGLAGCASTPHYALQEPIGPGPEARAETAGDGVLQVYSARQPAHVDSNYAVFFQGESFLKDLAYLPAHTDYSLYAADGRLLRWVQNSRSTGDAQPTMVKLPPGRYQVEAEVETGDGNSATVSFPVVVEPSKTTTVYLDGGWTPAPASIQNEVVALPNGQIAGWRADLSAINTASSFARKAGSKKGTAVGGAE